MIGKITKEDIFEDVDIKGMIESFLPSDEEIQGRAGSEYKSDQEGFEAGAKWMKELINQRVQNK